MNLEKIERDGENLYYKIDNGSGVFAYRKVVTVRCVNDWLDCDYRIITAGFDDDGFKVWHIPNEAIEVTKSEYEANTMSLDEIAKETAKYLDSIGVYSDFVISGDRLSILTESGDLHFFDNLGRFGKLSKVSFRGEVMGRIQSKFSLAGKGVTCES